MNKLIYLLTVLFLLGGCAARYTHPTKGPQELEQDIKDCTIMARGAVIARGAPDTC